jgi:hypothetical protein
MPDADGGCKPPDTRRGTVYRRPQHGPLSTVPKETIA